MERRRALVVSRSVNQDIHSPERLNGCPQQLFQRRSVANITSNTERSTAQRLNLIRRHFHQFDAPRTRHHVGACLGQPASQSPSDSGATSDNDRNLPTEFQPFIAHDSSKCVRLLRAHYQLNIVPSSFRFTGRYARTYGNSSPSFSS